MSRLFWKIFLTMWISIVFFSAAVGLINDMIARGQWAEDPASTFSSGMERISQRSARVLYQSGRDGLIEELRSIPLIARSHIFVEDEQGIEILGRDRPLQALTDSGRPEKMVNIVDASGNTYIIHTFSRAPPGAFLAPGIEGTLLRIFAAALISAFVSFFLAKSLTSPLQRMRDTSRKIAGGDLNARVGELKPPRRDEIGELAEDFDLMADRLQHMQSANRRLLRDVSHELRSPLARMAVAFEIARKKGAGNATAELDRIQLDSERLETLVNDVLGLLRESSETSPRSEKDLDISHLLDDLAETVSYEAPEDTPGVDWPGSESLMYKGDRELLWRAIENLLRNALRHTDPTRGVQLRLDNEQDGEIKIMVRDFGPGVPESEVEKIFQPFYRVHESRDRNTGGHGLGLSIASAAIRRHGGRISAANAVDGGLIVTIILPVEKKNR
ncbi:MAG TPA: ATP-binding protein [Xanthomonadales bacterium]|nr:ATP-binding protein [Xanthomonadales bacterium]